MKRQSMSKDQIKEARTLFGPAPILSSEAPELFEIFFEQLAICLGSRDIVEFTLIWHYAVDSWRVNRAIRHSTLAIERRYQEGVRQKLQRARLLHAQKQAASLNETRSLKPSDIAALIALEENILSVAEDVDEILKRKAIEQDQNLAFERSMIFQEQLDKLITSASHRRDDALEQLELYRIALGAPAQDEAGTLLEGEAQEIFSTVSEAPALAPPCPDTDLLPGITADGSEDDKTEKTVSDTGDGMSDRNAETE